MLKRKGDNRGFTLVEVIIAITIFTIIIGIGYTALNKMNLTTKEQQLTSTEQLNANLINKYLTKDLENCSKFNTISERKFIINEDTDQIEYEVRTYLNEGKEFYDLNRTQSGNTIEVITKQPKLSNRPFFIEAKDISKGIYTVSMDSNKSASKKYEFDITSRLIASNSISDPDYDFETSNNITFWADNKDNDKIQIGFEVNGHHGPVKETTTAENDSNIYYISADLVISNTGNHDVLEIGTSTDGSGVSVTDNIQTTRIDSLDKIIIEPVGGAKAKLTITVKDKKNSTPVIIYDNNKSDLPFIEEKLDLNPPTNTSYLTISGWFEKAPDSNGGVNIKYGKLK